MKLPKNNPHFLSARIALCAGVLSFLAAASLANAATAVSLTPATTAPTLGSQFSLTIMVDPGNATDYAEKIQIDYPADALSVASFSYADPWTALSLSGYDDTDDTQGTLTRTAEYPGGFSKPTEFGTVTFLAKKIATGTIKIGESSAAYGTGSDAYIAGSGSSFSISEIPPAPAVSAPAPQTDAAADAVSAGFLTDPRTWTVAIAVILALIAIFLTLPPRTIIRWLGFKKPAKSE